MSSIQEDPDYKVAKETLKHIGKYEGLEAVLALPEMEDEEISKNAPIEGNTHEDKKWARNSLRSELRTAILRLMEGEKHD